MERAALSLAAAAITPVITKLGGLVAPYFGGDITRKELHHLQTIILPKIRMVLDTAENIDVAKLRPWLMALQASAYEAEDILDLYEYNKIKNEVSPPTILDRIEGKGKELFVSLLPRTRLKKSFEKLLDSANEADKLIPLLSLIHSTTQYDNTTMIRQQRVTVSGLSAPVFGRDREHNDLVNMLTKKLPETSSNGCDVIIHAIHGIGGAGKTTLAQYVYNDKRVEDHFDLKIWIHVSRTFDVNKITREIIQSIENLKSPPKGHLDALQVILSKDLKSKKFFLVLDDIWVEDKDRHLWDQLLIPLTKSGEAGNMILVTTRMKVTVENLGVESKKIIPLAEMKTKECWRILKHYAFADADKEIEDPQLADVGKKILCKLKNSPLAARLAGCLLGKTVTVEAWRRIFNTNMLGETLNVMLLSFQHLPPHLQRCFAICSLYPKGYIYDSINFLQGHISEVNRLIQLWIAQGYVEASGNESLEEKGKQCFDELVSYSLFQRLYKNGPYVMHDLVHDAAEEVSKGYCFRIEINDPINISATIIHLSIVMGTIDLNLHIPNILKLTKLRTFIVVSSVEVNYPIDQMTEMFQKLTKLRALRFGQCSVPELGNSVHMLKHLRLLQLRGVKRLSESLVTLYHLQFLDLQGIHYEFGESIDRFLKSLENLSKLRCLSLPHDAYSKIEGIGKLVHLQELEVYDVKKCGGLQQLKNLGQLKGQLKIRGLENVKDKTGAMNAELNVKGLLEGLTLEWKFIRDSDVGGMMLLNREEGGVLEGLEPHPSLQKLCIINYTGGKSPSWLGILNNLTSLSLMSCPSLTGLVHLPRRLKNLDIWECPGLIQLPNFPSGLEQLRMQDCPGAEAFLWSAISSSSSSSCEGDEELQSRTSGHRQPSSFSLQFLRLENCCGVEEKTLNGVLMSDRFSSLFSLELSNMPSMTSLCLGPHLTALDELHIYGLKNLSSLQDMRSVKSLETLEVYRCPMLTAIGGGGGGGENITDCRFSSIEERLMIDEPLMLPVLIQQQTLNSRTWLTIGKCPQDVAFTAEQEDVFLHMTSLPRLSFLYCENMPSLPATLESLSSLESLFISYCPKLDSLPNLPPSLKSLSIDSCPQLKDKYEAGGPLRPQIDHIPYISIKVNEASDIFLRFIEGLSIPA